MSGTSGYSPPVDQLFGRKQPGVILVNLFWTQFSRSPPKPITTTERLSKHLGSYQLNICNMVPLGNVHIVLLTYSLLS